jgi:hypothetical protein
MIKRVKILYQRIFQVLHIALWVQDFPWVAALVALARFEHHHESVEARDHLREALPTDLEVRSDLLVREEIVELAWVILDWSRGVSVRCSPYQYTLIFYT